MFAFDLYDADSSGYIERNEIEGMLGEVYGGREALADPAYTITKEVMYKLTKKEDDALEYGDLEERRNAPKTEVSAPQFERFSAKHPSLLYPAYQFQEKLQRAVIGHRFWEEKAVCRLALTSGMKMTTTQFLRAMMNEAYFKHLLERPFEKPESKGGLVKEAPNEHELAHRQRLMDNGGSVASRRNLKGIIPEFGKDQSHLKSRRRSVLGAVGGAVAAGMRRLSTLAFGSPLPVAAAA